MKIRLDFKFTVKMQFSCKPLKIKFRNLRLLQSIPHEPFSHAKHPPVSTSQPSPKHFAVAEQPVKEIALIIT